MAWGWVYFFNIPCEQLKLDLLSCKAPGLGYLFFLQISVFLWGGLSNSRVVAEGASRRRQLRWSLSAAAA